MSEPRTFDRAFYEIVLHACAAMVDDPRALPALPAHERLSLAEVETFWRAVEVNDTHGTLGAEIGLRFEFTRGVIQTILAVASSAESVLEALRLVGRYYSLVASQCELRTELNGEELHLVPIYSPGQHSWVGCQTTVAAIYCGLKQITPAVPLTRVEFRAPVGAEARRRLSELFGAPALGHASRDHLVFPRTFGAQRVLEVDQGWMREQLELADAAMASLEVEATSHRVLRVVQATLPESCSIEAVARALEMSPRTLQRALKTEGNSFRSLLEKARVTLARFYFGVGASVVDAAFFTGYSDSTAFTRAYRRVTGHPPSHDLRR